MLTLIGSLMGFAGSAVPSVIDLFKEKSERQKQVELARLQMERCFKMPKHYESNQIHAADEGYKFSQLH